MQFEEWWPNAAIPGCTDMAEIMAKLAWRARDAEVEALKARVAELENLISTFVESYRSRYSKTGGGIRSSAPMRREIAELNSAAKALGE